VIAALYLAYQGAPGKHGATASGSGFKHVAGQPGAGNAAPTFTLT
jgi:peroxiredoxin Q/BCP